jgi:farnesol dehydrogenase
MTFYVTGATGFIGSVLTRRLLQEGHRVVALVRPRSTHKATEAHENLFWIEGDLLDLQSLLKSMEGCDRVFHVAGYASVWAPDNQLFYDINVTGTRNVLQAAKEVGIDRLVYTSTAATLPPADSDVPTDETSEKKYFHNPYEHSKYLAEQKVLSSNSEHLKTLIVHPTRVFGPGPLTESNAVTRIMKYYLQGIWRFQLSDGDYIGNYCYVRDLVEGHLLTMNHGTPGEQYILGGNNLTFKELFHLIGEVAGKHRYLIPLPVPIMQGFARLEKLRANTLGGKPQITPDWINKYLQNWVVSSEKAQQTLGYKITPARKAIQKTIQWLKRMPRPDEKP